MKKQIGLTLIHLSMCLQYCAYELLQEKPVTVTKIPVKFDRIWFWEQKTEQITLK